MSIGRSFADRSQLGRKRRQAAVEMGGLELVEGSSANTLPGCPEWEWEVTPKENAPCLPFADGHFLFLFLYLLFSLAGFKGFKGNLYGKCFLTFAGRQANGRYLRCPPSNHCPNQQNGCFPSSCVFVSGCFPWCGLGVGDTISD